MSGFAWTEFYSEFATSLLSYADERAILIEKVKQIYINAKMKLPTLEKENNIVDIDPFTVFGLFNKGITNDNRIAILSQIKELFRISADVFDYCFPSVSKYSFTRRTTVPERRNRAIRFGMAIRPLKVSAILHIRPRSAVAPRMATREYTTMNGLITFSLNKNSMQRAP